MLLTPSIEHHARTRTRVRVNVPYVPAILAAGAVTAARASHLTLPQGRDVHVWHIDLRDMGTDAVNLLDAAELARAQRFVYAHDWRRYVAGHAWLRRVLGAYLGIAPQHLRFDADAHGKPMLAHRHTNGDAALRFNMSHSKDIALIAVTSGPEVGVDIEALRDDLPGPDLAAGVLSAGELGELARCAPQDHPAVFVGCWTRKEACLKALGVGLGLEPRALDVGLQAQRMTLHLDSGEPAVDLAPLPCPPGYAAALAVVGGFGDVARQDTALVWEGMS
ncbi:4'-phosphopantetheinyl transferase psf-1 [mine drainage metagenome]|uniref:4'-phosphopantetheinyl transferase psf-1 n=1 Tax=mine drainage metagenome TaxID=410659 RepID=A0A1J5QYB8_9ZZZZ